MTMCSSFVIFLNNTISYTNSTPLYTKHNLYFFFVLTIICTCIYQHSYCMYICTCTYIHDIYGRHFPLMRLK